MHIRFNLPYGLINNSEELLCCLLLHNAIDLMLFFWEAQKAPSPFRNSEQWNRSCLFCCPSLQGNFPSVPSHPAILVLRFCKEANINNVTHTVGCYERPFVSLLFLGYWSWLVTRNHHQLGPWQGHSTLFLSLKYLLLLKESEPFKTHSNVWLFVYFVRIT